MIPEVDHLLGHRLGAKARHAFYPGLTEGDYVVADVPHDQFERIAAFDRRFVELHLGFVDSSIVVLPEVLGVRRIGTTDRRHFAPLAAALSLELRP